jgi:HAD superfamily hydrolase (TIGR01484 family)
MIPTTVFLDIDGTLIDIDQRPTTATLPELITEMRRLGFSFGLNSNRSKEDVRAIIEQFNLDGPFILENGAYMIDRGGHEVLFAPQQLHIQNILLQSLATFMSSAQVQLADTTSLYTTMQSSVGTQIYINKFRKHSGSIHHRVNGESNFAFAEDIAAYLNAQFSTMYPELIAVAHHHGHSVTIENIGVTKATGCLEYKKLHPEQKIVAIGDGINDIVLKEVVDELYAVANADVHLKEVATYVSPYAVTAGVEQILNRLKEGSISSLL